LGLRDKMRALERMAQDHVRSFELADGSRYYYDPQSAEMFLHVCECLRAHDKPERPEPPELVKAIALARDRRVAYEQATDGAGTFEGFPYDTEALIERGEIVPISLVVGRELGEPLPDLSS
jgi:hypothetical protein